MDVQTIPNNDEPLREQDIIPLLDKLRAEPFESPYTWALEQLRSLGVDRVFALLTALLNGYDEHMLDQGCVLGKAAEAAVKLDVERGVMLILPLLVSQDWTIRWEIECVLRDVDVQVLHKADLARRALNLLLPAVTSSDNQLRAFAITAIGYFGDKLVFDILAELLADEDIEIRCAATEAVLRLDAEHGVDTVLPLLNDPNVTVRWHTCGCLHDFGDVRATEALVQRMLTDLDIEVRHVAAFALGWAGDIRALPALTWAAEHDSAWTQHGHSVQSAATESIIEILARVFIEHITAQRYAEARQLFSPSAQRTRAANLMLADVQYAPRQYGKLRNVTFHPIKSTRDVPFSVKIDFEHEQASVQRVLVFSRTDDEWAIQEIFETTP